MNIRKAEPDDVLRGLLGCLSSLSPIGEVSNLDAIYALNARIRQGVKTFVATIGARVVGTASVLVEQKLIRGLGKVGHVEDVAVHREHQGKGVGKALMEHIINYCRKGGLYKLVLTCEEDVVPFYEKLGFRRHGLGMRMDLKT